MSIVQICADAFSYTANMDGHVLDNDAGLGGGIETASWLSKVGNLWTAALGVANNANVGADEVIVVNTTARAACKVKCKLRAQDCGVIFRWKTGANGYGQFYMLYRDSGNHVVIYRLTDAGGLHAIYTTSETIGNTSVVELEMDATTVMTLSIDGVGITVTGDSDIATGLPGLYGGGGGTASFDDFIFFAEAAVSAGNFTDELMTLGVG